MTDPLDKHFTTVPNKADMFPQVEVDPDTYDIESITKKFWKAYSTEDSLDWYREGFQYGMYGSDGTTGGELLHRIAEIINLIAIKHLRKHNKPVDSNVKNLNKILLSATEVLLSSTVETINANEGTLDIEEVTAFLHGWINAHYEKIRTQYVD